MSDPSAAVSTVERVILRLELDADQPLPLAKLGAMAGWTPEHLQRTFKRLVGVSPRQYQEAFRLGLLKAHLRDGLTVTDAIFASGYGSLSRVYESSDATLGMTPKCYQRAGHGVDIFYIVLDTALGKLLVAGTERGLCAVRFGDHTEALLHGLAGEFSNAFIRPSAADPDGPLALWASLIDQVIAGAQVHLEALPLDLQGTAFQIRVWTLLRQIPSGTTTTYGTLARSLGSPKAYRAVANACAANAIGVVVPCHRVLRADGGLGGFRWGLERKRKLLALEARYAP